MKLFERNCSGTRGQILSKTVDKISLHFKTVTAGMLAGLSLYSFYPFYDFIFNGNFTSVCPVHWPFTDHTKLQGYLIESTVGVYMATLGAIHNYAFSLLLFLYINVYDGMVSLMEYDFKEFDTMCEINKHSTIRRRRALFTNLTLKAMDLARYTI